MSKKIVLNSISQAHEALGLAKPLHPLVTVVRDKDIPTSTNLQDVSIVMNLYRIVLKYGNCGTLQYGRNAYDYEDGTLMFTAPGQVVKQEGSANLDNSDGWTLGFHPDLIRKSDLGGKIHHYTFFNYDVSEALHLSEREKAIIEGIIDTIVLEYSQNLDKHSQSLIIKNIELLLDYCLRFYDRQFYTRTNLNNDVVSNFEKLLREYYQSNKAQELGTPTVSYCGQALNLSPNYLSDLLKKETGKTTQEHIHLFIIDRAKNKLLNSTHSISEIGYDLGFEYPQHFSSLFKSKTGLSPKEYRTLN